MNPESLPLVRPPAGPLVGVRVLDFCSFIAGTYGAMLLGDLGADVIKVEPLNGDLARAWGPFLAGESRFFQGWNRSKRGIALDLHTAGGRAIVAELVQRADVVVENFRPGVTEKLGIDYPRLKQLNPRLIYCSSTAFGPRGPYRLRPGYDPVLQALSGGAVNNARYCDKVALSSVAVSDYQAAMLAATGVAAALYHREKTGEGQLLETSLLQGAMSVQSHYFCEALERDEEGPLGIYPYRLFETQDGMLFIGAATDKFWRILCETLGMPEWSDDPRYATNPQRVANQADLTPRLAAAFQTRTARAWEELLVSRGFPCGRVQTFSEFLVDPQVTAMGMNPVVEHPTIGPLRLAGVPVHFEKTPGCIQRAAPTLGQHTSEILRELGYDKEQIAAWHREGVIAGG